MLNLPPMTVWHICFMHIISQPMFLSYAAAPHKPQLPLPRTRALNVCDQTIVCGHNWCPFHFPPLNTSNGSKQPLISSNSQQHEGLLEVWIPKRRIQCPTKGPLPAWNTTVGHNGHENFSLKPQFMLRVSAFVHQYLDPRSLSSSTSVLVRWVHPTWYSRGSYNLMMPGRGHPIADC